MSYHASYFDGAQPYWADLPPRTGRLAYGQNYWLTMSYHPLMTDSQRIAINAWTLETADDKHEGVHKTKLRAGLRAIMLLILEYRAAAFNFDNVYKSQADAKASDHAGYRMRWMEQRVKDAFDACMAATAKDLNKVALLFKPSCLETYAKEIEASGYAIKLVDEDALTPEICLASILSEPGSLFYVPGRIRTRELCLIAMQTRAPGASALQYVPPSFKDAEMCDAAVNTDGLNLQHVPDDLKTVERCALACIKDGLAWSYVPYSSRTLEVRFCYALHGYSEESADAVYKESEVLDLERAEAMVDKYEPLFVKTHYPMAEAGDLADLGWPEKYAQC